MYKGLSIFKDLDSDTKEIIGILYNEEMERCSKEGFEVPFSDWILGFVDSFGDYDTEPNKTISNMEKTVAKIGKRYGRD